ILPTHQHIINGLAIDQPHTCAHHEWWHKGHPTTYTTPRDRHLRCRPLSAPRVASKPTLTTPLHRAHTHVPMTTSSYEGKHRCCKHAYPHHTSTHLASTPALGLGIYDPKCTSVNPPIVSLLGAPTPIMPKMGYGTPNENVTKALEGYYAAGFFPAPIRGKTRRGM
ncbi:hypothetical protein AMTR_s00047p00172640, partial [Amborella trichopoda]